MPERSYTRWLSGCAQMRRNSTTASKAVQFEEEALREEVPTMILGLIGFSREQHASIAWILDAAVESPVNWRTGNLPEADAWIVNGARTQILGDGSLRVGPGEAGGRSVRLALHEIDRPIAFSEPLASRDFEPALTFSMEAGGSLEAMLEIFHTRWLATKAACLALGARLVSTQHTLTQRVYHLVHGGRLVATIDRTGDVGLMPGVTVAAIQCATWEGRPSSAGSVPPGFHRTTISELAWSYALRADADLLPSRYRTASIHFRRPPKVPQRLIGDDHLLLMRELVRRAACFDELQERTGLGARLSRTLAALYLTGSVTTNPQRARTAPVAAPRVEGGSNDESMWSPTRSCSMFGVHAHAHAHAFRADFTVPARLPMGTSNGGAAHAVGAT